LLSSVIDTLCFAIYNHCYIFAWHYFVQIWEYFQTRSTNHDDCWSTSLLQFNKQVTITDTYHQCILTLLSPFRPEHSCNPIPIEMIRRLHAVNSTLGNEIVLYQLGHEEWYW
jgi:hypothetical protein